MNTLTWISRRLDPGLTAADVIDCLTVDIPGKPGVHCIDGSWVAWDHDPHDREAIIEITADDLNDDDIHPTVLAGALARTKRWAAGDTERGLYDVGDITLPNGIHARRYGDDDSDPVVVVWANRATGRCDRCDSPVHPTEIDNPDILWSRGRPIDAPRQCHQCGTYSSHTWEWVRQNEDDENREDLVAPGISVHTIERVADLLSAGLEKERDDQTADAQREIRRSLIAALKRLTEPLTTGETAAGRVEEVTTGSEIDEGVYCEDGIWHSWVYDPLFCAETDEMPADVENVCHEELTGKDIPADVLAAALALTTQAMEE